VWKFLYYIAAPFLKLALRYKCKAFRQPDEVDGAKSGKTKIPLIVISNHLTDLDPFFVGASFPGQLYFLASEHIFRWGFWSRVLKLFFDPLAITKGAGEMGVIREMVNRIKAGANLCFFAEGNRSFSGTTMPFPAATGKLVRISGAALVTYKLRGAYFAQPRWCRGWRKGPVRGEVVAYYAPETIAAMKANEINALVARDIYEDAYETMKIERNRYRGKTPAEYLETALYLCPVCGKIGGLVSAGDLFRCVCGFSSRYDEYGELHPNVPEGVTPLHKPFASVRDWWNWQQNAMKALVEAARAGEAIVGDDNQFLYEVDPHSGQRLLENAAASLSREGFRCGEVFIPLDAMDAVVYNGRQALSFSASGKRYDLISEKPRSAVKYHRVFELLKENSNHEPH
jgi:1-acyl-sn-glycerol-3-phosphate acyltransferase